MTAKKSGLRVQKSDVPIILGMIARNDRRHDIASWFGLNPGRIKSAEDGKYGKPAPTLQSALPPSGPPGIKGRRLRGVVNEALGLLAKGDAAAAKKALAHGAGQYDANEG